MEEGEPSEDDHGEGARFWGPRFAIFVVHAHTGWPKGRVWFTASCVTHCPVGSWCLYHH